MLERFRKAKRPEIEALKEMAVKGTLSEPFAGRRPGFTAALRAVTGAPVIAEYKRASPSKGVLDERTTPEAAAAAYAQAGAGAMSVLTEEEYFHGSLDFLDRAAGARLPLLRKDFIFHPLQVTQTAATPASAMLLIVRMLDASGLAGLIADCRRYGLEAVVEIFDDADLEAARSAGAEIIQVNNRDLDRLEVSLDVSRNLVQRKQSDEFWITASGIETPDQLSELLGLGFDAALIGSSLMQGGDPGRALAALRGAPVDGTASDGRDA